MVGGEKGVVKGKEEMGRERFKYWGAGRSDWR